MLVVDQSVVTTEAAAVKQRFKTFVIAGSVAGLTVLAVVFALAKVKHLRGDGEDGAKVWFYDQNTKRLYPAPRDLIPPDGNSDARVRAMVISFQGLGNDVSQLKIAYLEKYSPDCKALLDRAQVPTLPNSRSRRRFPRQTALTFKTTPW